MAYPSYRNHVSHLRSIPASHNAYKIISYIPPRLPRSEVLRLFWPAPGEFPGAITELSFRAALDEYDGAEMRFGK